MILGIGTDLANIERIGRTVERFGARFLDRVYTETEQRLAERRARADRHLRQALGGEGGLLQGARHRAAHGDQVAGHGRRQPRHRPADDGAHRLGRGAAGGDDPARAPRGVH